MKNRDMRTESREVRYENRDAAVSKENASNYPSVEKLIKRIFASYVIAKFIWQIQNTPNFVLKDK